MDKDSMKAGLKKIEGQVREMTEIGQDLGERLERAEAFIKKLGYCPHCEKRLAPRGMAKSVAFHAGHCRCASEV